MQKRISLFIFMLTISFISLQLNASSSNEPKKQRRVYVDMVGDLFHAGHINFLKQALAHGDYLIVGIHGDEVCSEYKRKPIMTLEERIACVKSCRYVDEVIPHAPLVVSAEYLDKHQIDVVMHGDDFNEETIKNFYGEPIARGIFKTIPYTKGVSTSEILRRILSRSPKEFFKKKS
ncbi:adenylyltransferase/cytidyltransferase family protein [bacterium]|nr:adenylyltransferase/cytidyltransferase family protein [bacterium]